MALSSVLAFWGIALLLIAVPGADWAFTLGTGARGRSVVPAVGGLMVGYFGLTLVVSVGVGTLVASTPLLLTALTLVGGLYLIWLGTRSLIRAASPSAQPRVEHGAGEAVFVRGIVVSSLNPKGLLLFLALLPQFANPRAAWPIAMQLALLGIVFTLTCGAFYLVLGTLARSLLLVRPMLGTTLSRLSGAAMILIGGALLLERIRS